jgi:AcrR family transcriptional regulator
MTETVITKRKLQAIETRKKFYDTAIALFSSKGYNQVTIDGICDAVGLSKGAFYTHFKSKGQIIIEYFLNADQYYDQIFGKLSEISGSIEKLRFFTNHALKYMNKLGPSSLRVVFSVQIAPEPEPTSISMISSSRTLYRILVGIFLDGQRNGEIRKDIPAEQLVVSLVGCFWGIIYAWLLYDGKKSIEEIAKPAIEVIICGLLSQ